MSILSKLWGLVPALTKIWVYLGAALLIFGFLVAIYAAIERNGYDRCEAKHTAAAAELQEKAREGIIKTREKYDGIRSRVAGAATGDSVGPGVEHAIDSMPFPAGR